MHYFKFPFSLFLSSLFLHASLAEIVCEDLPRDVCAFSISSSGKRCLLETTVGKDDGVEYECRTSEVVVERMAGYIESDKCVRACGVDRNSTGISSDLLLEPKFTAKLCAHDCRHSCHNIVDLFFNLAAGEGVFLPDLCAVQRTNPRRSVVSKFEATLDSIVGETPPSPIFSEDSDLAPSSEQAHGPISSEELDLAPSSEEAPGLNLGEESDLASSSGESLGPISGEASAPTPSPLGALGPASTLAPGPAPVRTSILAPTPVPLGYLAPTPTPSPASMGALASTPTPTPTPTQAPAPMGALASSPTSVPGPAPLGALVSALISDLASSSAPNPIPMG